MHGSLTQIIQEAVLEGRKPAKRVAQEIDKPYPTLLREINPNDPGAKVGVESLIPIMQTTGNIKPLEYLARAMGFVIVSMNTECVSSWQAVGYALDALEDVGELSKTLRKALVQGKLTQGDFEHIERSAYEMASATLTLVECLRQMVDSEEEIDIIPFTQDQPIAAAMA